MQPSLAYLPTRMDFLYGDVFDVNGLFLRFHDGVLFRLKYGFEDVRPDKPTWQCDPPQERWLQFWQEVERIGVWDWQPSYVNPDVLDGDMWSFELEFNGRRLKTEGSNAYPGAPDGLQFPADCAFGQFLAALRRLTGIKRI